MKLPLNDKVIISKEKFLDYILSETHITGKFKAKFFRKCGFHEENLDLFIKLLKKIASASDIIGEQTSIYGTKYIIDGEINTPSGQTIKIRTIWIIQRGETRPRFVTIYPV